MSISPCAVQAACGSRNLSGRSLGPSHHRILRPYLEGEDLYDVEEEGGEEGEDRKEAPVLQR